MSSFTQIHTPFLHLLNCGKYSIVVFDFLYAFYWFVCLPYLNLYCLCVGVWFVIISTFCSALPISSSGITIVWFVKLFFKLLVVAWKYVFILFCFMCEKYCLIMVFIGDLFECLRNLFWFSLHFELTFFICFVPSWFTFPLITLWVEFIIIIYFFIVIIIWRKWEVCDFLVCLFLLLIKITSLILDSSVVVVFLLLLLISYIYFCFLSKR